MTMISDAAPRKPSPDELREWARDDFGISLTSVEAVEAGADIAADVWRAEATDGARYAVKHTAGGSGSGLVLTARLAAAGVTGVPAPLRSRAGELSSRRADRQLTVTPWVGEAGAIGTGLTRRQWTAFGALLAQVHGTTVVENATEVAREEHDHERFAAELRAVHHRLSAQDADDFADDPLIAGLTEVWHDAATMVPGLLAGADELGGRLRALPVTRVLCHGDPHLGNVRVGGTGRVWLIDWDDAILAPREKDLMFVLGGVLFFQLVGVEEQAWFFEGYGPVDIDPVRIAYHRCTRAMEDLAGPAAQVLDSAGFDDGERREALEIVTGVLSPAGLATSALTSLRELGV